MCILFYTEFTAQCLPNIAYWASFKHYNCILCSRGTRTRCKNVNIKEIDLRLCVTGERRVCWLGRAMWRDGPTDIVCVLLKVRRAHHCSVLIVPAPLSSRPPLPRAAVLLFPQENSPISYTYVFLRIAQMCGVAMSPCHRTAALHCATTSPFIL